MQGKHPPAVLPFLRSPAVRCETMSRLWHYQAGDEPVHRRMMVRSRPLVLPYLLVPAHYPTSAARRAERSLTGSKRRAQAVRLPFEIFCHPQSRRPNRGAAGAFGETLYPPREFAQLFALRQAGAIVVLHLCSSDAPLLG